MDVLTAMGLYLVVFGAFTYVLMFGAGNTGVVGKLHFFLTDGMLELAEKWGPRLLGRRVFGCLRWACDGLFNRPTIAFQLFYLGLIGGGIAFYFRDLHHLVPWHSLPWWHVITVPSTIFGCFLSFALCSFADPGVITHANAARHQALYHVDGTLYEHKQCRTCKLPRPARSKHCKVCGHCVARFDHHCIWMNSCIGFNNFRWFLFFLFMHCFICCYGSYLMWCYVSSVVETRHLWLAQMVDSSGKRHPMTYRMLGKYLLQREGKAMALTIFLVVVCALLAGFLVQNLWYAAHNWTTNETIKFDGIEQTFNSESYQKSMREWEEHLATKRSKGKQQGKSSAGAGAADNKPAAAPEQQRQTAKAEPGFEDNPLAGMDEETVARLKRFVGGDMKRLFDRGVVANLKEVLFPGAFLREHGKGRERAPVTLPNAAGKNK